MTDEGSRRGGAEQSAAGPGHGPTAAEDALRPVDEGALTPVDEGAPTAVEPLWTVGAVAAEVGLAAPTLRSWDRRYGVGPTARTDGRHRRYTAADIRRVRLMSLLTANGVPASSAAATVEGLSEEQVVDRLGGSLARVPGPSAVGGARPGAGGTEPGAGGTAAGPGDVAEDGAEDRVGDGDGEGVGGSDTGAGAAWGVVDAICSAARALDARLLAQHFRQALRRDDLVAVWNEVLAPALTEIGRMWSVGAIGIDGEHLASEVLSAELRTVTRAHRMRCGPPRVLLAAADDEQHHLPLLALEAELALRGIGTRMLGPRVPTAALVTALEAGRLPVVFVWASMPRTAAEPMWRSLASYGRPVTVVVGGPGWPAHLRVPLRPGLTVVRVDDFAGAVDALDRAAAA